jgi:23S rRNA pseudouridine2605 synthase
VIKQRLSKVLQQRGIASRRACEEIIREGRVEVNNKKVIVPETMVDSDKDLIKLDKVQVPKEEDKIYYILNKPKGYHCTNAPEIKKRAIDLIRDPSIKRFYTVGRLDRDTEGLIIITNDGHFAHQVMHPRFEVEKEYLVKVDGEVTADHLKIISKGRFILGSYIKPKKVVKIRRGTLKIIVKEGKKHEVRSLVERADLEITELKRIRIGHLILGSLPVGASRRLTQKEIQQFLSTESEDPKLRLKDNGRLVKKNHSLLENDLPESNEGILS